MGWEAVIGLEIHVQLKTKSKIFSGAATHFGAEPNTQACAVDLGLPGVLPVLNREAVSLAIKFGLGVGAELNRRSIFARKNYFYPDSPKGYQISQYELPIVGTGKLSVQVDENTVKTIGITRAHLEEDAGKSLHEDFSGSTGIDLNRAGTPLLEIVSDPDMRSAKEAVAYLKAIHSLVTYLDICDGNMAEGSMRCDANVSVRRQGAEKFGTRAEIKNVNSFRFVEKAINYEIERQINLLESGETIVQETRLYDANKNETRSMRSKEEANDYRYFPDPDLLPVVLDESLIEQLRAALPELPQAKAQRYQTEFALTGYDASVLTASRDLAQYFEALLAELGSQHAKLAANWVMGELLANLNRTEADIQTSPVSASQLAGLLRRITDNSISGKIAKQVFDLLWTEGGDADTLIDRHGLKQVTDTGAIESLIEQVLAANGKQVEEYRAGNDKVFGFLVGQAMKLSKGKANPQQLNELLKQKLLG